jgi:hypothetical protein
MGTSLSYQSDTTVPEPTRSEVVQYLTEEASKRDWWAESLILFDTPHLPGHIVGDTKLFCLIDDDLADCFMAMTDAVFIVELLEAVSAKYKIDWTLSLAGSPCGQVINSTRDAELANSLDSFAMLADEDGGDFGNYDRDRLLAENPDR